MHKWFVYDEFDTASKAAADYLANTIESCLIKKEICHVALPGGNSPALCLNYLAEKKIDWKKIHWYLGDERCCPVDHPDRNDLMLKENLWSKIGDTNVHVIPAEKGAEKAAELYRDIIDSVGSLDVVLLGMGEDGHTASLFPDNEALDDSRSVVPVYHSPKPPSERVSLSITTLSKAHCRIVLTSGAAKASIIKRIKEDEPLPINSLGSINWFVDETVLSNI